jgi:hypothetical protein
MFQLFIGNPSISEGLSILCCSVTSFTVRFNYIGCQSFQFLMSPMIALADVTHATDMHLLLGSSGSQGCEQERLTSTILEISYWNSEVVKWLPLGSKITEFDQQCARKGDRTIRETRTI